MGVIDVSRDNIQAIIQSSGQKPAVFVFFSTQSPESMQQLQQLEQLHQDQFTLARVSCDADSGLEIAQSFRIQELPTVVVLDQGQVVDGVGGLQTTEQMQAILSKHLPPAWQVHLMAAREILAKEPEQQGLLEAVSLLQQAQSEENNDDIRLTLADALLQLGESQAAQQQLLAVGLAGQDSYYQNLMAKLKLAQEAADTPEIRQLQQDFEQNSQDLTIRMALAKALHQAKRDQEALDLLFEVLRKDLNAQEGDLKALFLSILTAIGQGNPIANQYRRQLYSLLY